MSNVLLQRSLTRVIRASWRCRRALNFVAKKGNVLIPMTNGIGLELLDLDKDAGVVPVLRHFYRAGCRGAVVDVGANIGIVLLSMLEIDPRVPYIGFEPSLQAAAYVHNLITLNHVESTHSIYPVALSDACSAAVLQANGAHDASATIDTESRPSSMYSERTSVCVSTGDILLRNIPSIDVIKIDVEGNERRVLAGLMRTIQQHRPALIVEVMPYTHLADGSYSQSYFGHLTESKCETLVHSRKQNMEEVNSFMVRNNYTLYQMHSGSLRETRLSESTLANQDFVAVPSERLEKFDVGPT